MSYVEEGTKARKTASTLQNPSSSRSHALLTVDLSQETSESEPSAVSDASSPRRRDANPRNPAGSRLHLVDLAGSESAATCGGVHRLKVSHPLKIISSGRRISRDEDRYFPRANSPNHQSSGGRDRAPTDSRSQFPSKEFARNKRVKSPPRGERQMLASSVASFPDEAPADSKLPRSRVFLQREQFSDACTHADYRLRVREPIDP